MLLNLKFVVGLLATAAISAASNNTGFSVDLVRRSDSIRYSQFDAQRTHKHLMGITWKYIQALENFLQNTGKEFPLKFKSHEKRSSATIDLVDVQNGVEWAGELRFGTPEQSIYFDFDTGSADTLCNPNAYNPKKSSTSSNTHTSFSTAYGDGTQAHGNIYTDVFHAGGIHAKHVAIGHSTSTFISSSERPNQGIAGLANPSIQAFDSKFKPFFTDIRDQKVVNQGVFQFTIKAGSCSTLQLGRIDKSKFKGDLTWVNYNPALGFYVVPAKVNGKSILTIIDSGTTLIIGPTSQIRSLMQKLPNVTMFISNGALHGRFPCNKPPKVTFNFGGKDFSLGKDQISYGKSGNECVLSIVGQDGMPLNAWIVGDSFFQTVSVVFDQDNNRVGFAPQA